MTSPSAPSSRHVLIVEDEESIRDALVELLDDGRNDVHAAASLSDALTYLSRSRFDLIITDIRLGGNWDGGLQVMGAAGMLSPDAPVVALTAYPDDANRFAARRLGALYFLEKPADLLTLASLASRHGIGTTLGTGAS
jgi:DNA-binding NtrC family response regulator